ncbi:uncharacterized protein AB675_1713 [Cyphellophora attinorum]|uniref:Uncharacterized protein n=1 Tax=Cyphellophora attinorum TaxID=1664694 RepID=A0A0N1HXK4_9EURO|nr:uncharacterized protein AB675_1713 [Phialophora attinorum]KPI42745.1 hypothetical protein AB675_1713 [Phialophora attinorum]
MPSTLIAWRVGFCSDGLVIENAGAHQITALGVVVPRNGKARLAYTTRNIRRVSGGRDVRCAVETYRRAKRSAHRMSQISVTTGDADEEVAVMYKERRKMKGK